MTEVQSNPDKFNISKGELNKRSAAIQKFSSDVREIKTTYDSPKIQNKIKADARKAMNKSGGARAARMKQAERDNDDAIAGQAQAQSQIVREQDVQLSMLGDTVDHLDAIGTTIQDALKEQDNLLDDLDDHVDIAQNKVDGAMGRLQKMLGAKNNCSIGMLCILLVVALVLMCVYFFT